MSVATLTLREITFPDITGKTIKIWGQVDVTGGTYTTGGLAFGLIALADGLTVDFNGFLRCDVWDEEPQGNTLVTYHYSPSGDVLQIFSGATELGNGLAVPINDVTVDPDAPVPISPRPSNLIMFEATFDRTSVRG